jgi:uncharacterized membrane protein (UPF0127 family)
MNWNSRAAQLAIALLVGLPISACTGSSGVGAQPATSSSCAAGANLGLSEAGLAIVKVCVTSEKANHAYSTEVAATSREQATGMMFRKYVADNAAMIFPFSEPRVASFWMKNTVIPLDIIFIRSNGTIESIAENVTPYSEEPVSSGEPVAAVLEVRGGLTRELGIKSGDVVRWK